jgi:DNA gyrase inhibitor GyrI
MQEFRADAPIRQVWPDEDNVRIQTLTAGRMAVATLERSASATPDEWRDLYYI